MTPIEVREFTLPQGRFRAAKLVDGVLVDPVLPKAFDNTPNEERPASQRKWWRFPFIVTDSVSALDAFYTTRTDEYADEQRRHWQVEGRAQWMAAWPSGTRYTVRCLDGGAWDRSTNWGSFPTLEEAIVVANGLPRY